MPELAEAETLRRDIDAEFSGQRIEIVSVSGGRPLRRLADPQEFVTRVQGRRLAATARRGKYLVLRLEDGPSVVAHMGMSGQLLRMEREAPEVRHTHAVLSFSGGFDLRYVDPRTFGEIFVTDSPSSVLARLGFDPLSEAGSWRELAERLAARRGRLKALLLDQTFVAGIGNMYADEILFAARLRYDRPASSLRPAEVRRLHAAMSEVLSGAIEHRGSSLADEQYRDLYGRLGGYQKFHNVYARAGSPCPRCSTPLVRERWAGRSSFFCPRCQR